MQQQPAYPRNQSHPKSVDPLATPDLNFDLDPDGSLDLISLNAEDLQSLELAVNVPSDSKSSHNVAAVSPDAETKRVPDGATKETESKPLLANKKIERATNIHPQQKQMAQGRAPQSIEVATGAHHLQSPRDAVTSPEDGFGYLMSNDDDDGVLFPGFEAPSLELTDTGIEAAHSNHSNDADHAVIAVVHSNHSPNHGYSNGGPSKQSAHPLGYAPTPREWQYDWNATPRNAQSMASGRRSPPMIRDPELIQSTLESIAYYADKLDGLHSEYRRCYSEQQQIAEYLGSLQQQQHTMDPAEYRKHYHHYHSSSSSLSQRLQSLIISIYEQFTEMKQRLSTRHDLQLDATNRSQFDKFQKYHDQFAQSQHHLLVFGRQQAANARTQKAAHPQQPPAQQQQQQPPPPQQQQQQNHHHQAPPPQHAQYVGSGRVPQTPSKYRNYVANSYKEGQQQQQREQSKNGQLPLHRHMAHVHSMTPRAMHSSSHQFVDRRAAHRVNYPQTTSSLDKRFQFSPQAQRHHNFNPMKPSRTPRSPPRSTREYGAYRKQQQQQQQRRGRGGVSEIPQMGFVYIGSRMSQLISQIGFTERELVGNQQRIQSAIASVLERAAPTFKGFDIVPYGSSTHKLFIKDYSDYDFCIRCQALTVPHKEAVERIAKGLADKFENVEVVDSVSASVHGHYLGDVEHIRLFDKASGRGVDVVLNNLPEIGSSRFIAAYESVDPRFAMLCRVVKYWARQRLINDPLTGTLSTFSLVLMVINFLQSRRVLPTLSIMIFDRETGLSPWSTQDDYQINVQKYRDFASKNEEPHSRLLVNFFHFYSHKFHYGGDVVSVRTGTLLTKSEKKWGGEHLMAVENPFNSKVNLTENVTLQSLHRICAEFKRAHSILCESYKIYEVCKLADH